MSDRFKARGSALRLSGNMYMLMTAALKFSTRPLVALAFASAYLALSGCGTQLRPEQPQADPLAQIADYATWLAIQPRAQFEAERTRLQALPQSSERELQLTVLELLENRQTPEETEQLRSTSLELSAQLAEEQNRRLDLQQELDAARRQLDQESSERTRLERQLKALKSLENQIKNRDE